MEERFDDAYEDGINTVYQCKEALHKFITERHQGANVPLCINPQSAAFKSFASSSVASTSELPPSPQPWE